MQSNSNSDILRSVGVALAHVIAEGCKDAQAATKAQAGVNNQAQGMGAKVDTEATQAVVALSSAVDICQAVGSSNATQATSTVPNFVTAAALQPPQEPGTFNQAIFHLFKASTKYALNSFIKWAEGEDSTNEAYAFADRLDIARINLHLLSARDAEALINRLMRDKSKALAVATPEQRKFVQDKWSACNEAYEKRCTQLRELERAPVEPSSGFNLNGRITAAQTHEIFQILIKTPYCDAQTHKVVRYPESAKALLSAYRRAGGTQMTDDQAASVRLAMGVIKRGNQPLLAAHLKTGEQE